PASWPGYSLRYRVPGHETQYAIAVTQERPRAARTVASLDGTPLEVAAGAVSIPLLTDGVEHQVHVGLGKDVGPRYHARPAAGDRGD
ncbi:MAG TPA: hypothetical protein VKP10_05740, partial [Gemmatimonadales bacterium]|nr:hypothetical protein [Gemmatimonadales bacterium]